MNEANSLPDKAPVPLTSNTVGLVSDRRKAYGRERSVCTCPECVAACRGGAGCLSLEDQLTLIPKHDNWESRLAWARTHLQASLGSVCLLAGVAVRIGKLIPASIKWTGKVDVKNECHWFDPSTKRCMVHADAPFGCAYFCNHNSVESNTVATELTLWHNKDLLTEFTKVDRSELARQYMMLWEHLWSTGVDGLYPYRAIHPCISRLLRNRNRADHDFDNLMRDLSLEELESLAAVSSDYRLYSTLAPAEGKPDIVTYLRVCDNRVSLSAYFERISSWGRVVEPCSL